MLYNFQRKKLYRRLLVGGALCAAGFGVLSCSDRYSLDEDQPSGLSNIYGYMQEKGNFTNYLHLIDDLGQKEILSKTGSKTMFIADDDAFKEFYESNSWGVRSYEELTLTQKKLLLNSSMIDNPYTTTMLSSAQSAGNAGRPVKGEVCRRSSSQSLYDSVLVVNSANADCLPDNDLFKELTANHEKIVMFTDASQAAPMVHFTGRFVTTNKLQFSDIDFLYNQEPGTFKSDEIYVNASKVISANIFCKNGFLHQVDKVIVPLDNMAEIIRKNGRADGNGKMKEFSKILERFAAPKDSTALRDAYNMTMGTDYDSVFVKRYFSDRSDGSTMSTNRPFSTDKNGKPFGDGSASLKYDPGWNGYVPYVSNDRQPMMEDLAVMLVPSDAAIAKWWNEESGTVIKEYYGTIDDTPNSVLDDLIRVNQLPTLTGALPSNFDGVLNDANEPLDITAADVDSVIIGCNGVVMLTNKVFTPTSYSSVLFPAVIDTTNFKILDNVISLLDYDKYLNSMVSQFIFLLPTNKGMLSYVDPVSYGQTTSNLWEFHLDLSKGKENQLYADVYDCVINENGEWTKASETRRARVEGGAKASVLQDRIEDLLDNIIVVEPYVEGKKYYKTKGRNFVKIEGSGDNMTVQGSWQVERGVEMQAKKVYPMRNGITIALDGVVMGTSKSVAKTLRDAVVDGDNIFSEIYGIVTACATSRNNAKNKWQAGDQEIGNLFSLKEKGSVGAEDSNSATGKANYLLNNYHYTFYAPTNDAMREAYAAGLPTLDDLDKAEAYDEMYSQLPLEEQGNYPCKGDSAARVREVMLDFVKYHVQDNAIFTDEGFASISYESGKTEMVRAVGTAEDTTQFEITLSEDSIRFKNNGKTYKISDRFYNEAGELTSVSYFNGLFAPGRPYKINVNVSSSGMTVSDSRYGYDSRGVSRGGVTASVDMREGAHNLMAREYWYNTGTPVVQPWSAEIDNSSFVVVQGIDHPLLFSLGYNSEDGSGCDSKGSPAATQFQYIYKPLATN